ncbi:hypothetical protein evm_009793 [Chilo suppressalis]|nr:hypothetical protein evm_009793 [Chilo suppressalis]
MSRAGSTFRGVCEVRSKGSFEPLTPLLTPIDPDHPNQPATPDPPPPCAVGKFLETVSSRAWGLHSLIFQTDLAANCILPGRTRKQLTLHQRRLLRHHRHHHHPRRKQKRRTTATAIKKEITAKKNRNKKKSAISREPICPAFPYQPATNLLPAPIPSPPSPPPSPTPPSPPPEENKKICYQQQSKTSSKREVI